LQCLFQRIYVVRNRAGSRNFSGSGKLSRHRNQNYSGACKQHFSADPPRTGKHRPFAAPMPARHLRRKRVGCTLAVRFGSTRLQDPVDLALGRLQQPFRTFCRQTRQTRHDTTPRKGSRVLGKEELGIPTGKGSAAWKHH
jgi:hypothetical protein